MSRLDATFERLQARNEKAMGLFLTDGFPTPDPTPIKGLQDRNRGVRGGKAVGEKEPHGLLVAGLKAFKRGVEA